MPLGSVLRRCLSGLVVVAIACPAMGRADDSLIDYHEFYGTFSMENRWFPESPAHDGQSDADTTFVAEPSLYLETADGTSFTLETFFRYDSADSERHLADVREAYLLFLGPLGDDEWELRLGFDHVFWGVAESRHLVDIINQTDLVANPNEEVKLGQPMAHLTVSGDWGVAELFALPWHRPRTYPGRDGRLRGEFVVDNDRLKYESAAGERHLDLAARYSHSIGLFDIGLSVFDGTSREPYLDPVLECGPVPDPAQCRVTLVPLYEQIRQFGLDAQMTTGGWLLKLEAIRRTGASDLFGRKEDFTAFVAGGEYTLYSVFESDIDLGLLAEWNRDSRRLRASNVFQNDVFLGSRLAFNDVEGTDLIFGVLADLDTGSRSFNVQMNRRLDDDISLNIEGSLFDNVGEDDPIYASRRDSFIAVNLKYGF
ncbi:MAG: hypothetical protein OXI95_01625 [bacterium]|nr:hypothetical protein [bacterium]